ncbi:hypothetical protein ACMFMG_001786 [Clarireedia jacksonii]
MAGIMNLSELVDHDRAFGHDVDSLQAANEYLMRSLYATARKYNQVWEELETIKASTGLYDKHLLFLSLPREVRDQIYLYALQAPREAFVGVRHTAMLSCNTYPNSAHYPFKPPTPGLLLVNKQIQSEATEVLYSHNKFAFHNPRELFDFQDQVGALNCALVRHIKISVLFVDESTYVPMEFVAPCDYENIPSHWVKALTESKLNHIVGMQVDADSVDGMHLQAMPPHLYKAILATFARNKNAPSEPQLVLKGFRYGEDEKFPRSWKVTTEQWLEVDWIPNAVDESEPYWNSSQIDSNETHNLWEESEGSPGEDGDSMDEDSDEAEGQGEVNGGIPTLFNELGELMEGDFIDSDSDAGSEDSFYTAAPWAGIRD